MRRISKILADVRGATAVEYGLILALVFLAMVGALTAFARGTTSMWNNVATEISGDA
jgi:pilus assembly protein Flp/PilA